MIPHFLPSLIPITLPNVVSAMRREKKKREMKKVAKSFLCRIVRPTLLPLGRNLDRVKREIREACRVRFELRPIRAVCSIGGLEWSGVEWNGESCMAAIPVSHA